MFLTLLKVVLFFVLLGWITGHGEYEKVPTVTGKNVEAARVLLKSKVSSIVPHCFSRKIEWANFQTKD
jgi:uncharacterized ion transporter superfamily protein YfcC